jgi:hypothetical protein
METECCGTEENEEQRVLRYCRGDRVAEKRVERLSEIERVEHTQREREREREGERAADSVCVCVCVEKGEERENREGLSSISVLLHLHFSHVLLLFIYHSVIFKIND